jgi:hypothetical protein
MKTLHDLQASTVQFLLQSSSNRAFQLTACWCLPTPQAAWLAVLAALALLATLPVRAIRSAPLSHEGASFNAPAHSMATQLPTPKKLAFPARFPSHPSVTLMPKPAPELRPKIRGGSKPQGAAAPAQSSACTTARSSRKANRCSNAGVTIPACLYSCWDSAHTTETCACCWAGHQLVGNKCEACPVGTYARTAGNACLKCNEGYSTFSDQSRQLQW